MDRYIPKRRVPVRLWTNDVRGVEGRIFLDLDPAGSSHQTILAKLNEPSRFLPVATGPEGFIQLFHKSRLVRMVPGAGVLQADVFARGFQPCREEEAEVWLSDGTSVSGRVWMPLERPSQRVSDYMNQRGAEFFVLVSGGDVQLVSTGAVTRMALAESAGAPLSPPDFRVAASNSWG